MNFRGGGYLYHAVDERRSLRIQFFSSISWNFTSLCGCGKWGIKNKNHVMFQTFDTQIYSDLLIQKKL